MRRWKMLAAAAAMVLGSASIGAAQEYVKIGTGSGGTYVIFTAKLAEMINQHMPGYQASTVAGPSEANQLKVSDGELQLAINLTFDAKQIYDGNGALQTPAPNVRHVMTLYGSVLMAVAQKDGIDDLSEAAEKPLRVWRGPKASNIYSLVNAALEANGVGEAEVAAAGGVIESFGYGQQVQAFQDGRLDVAFFSGPVPFGLLMEIEQTRGFKFVEFTPEEIEQIGEKLPGVASGGVIPAGTYEGQTEDVIAPKYINQLMVSADASDEFVYELTKMLNTRFEEFHDLFPGAEEITDKDPLAQNYLPVHPGAERYYREVGKL